MVRILNPFKYSKTYFDRAMTRNKVLATLRTVTKDDKVKDLFRKDMKNPTAGDDHFKGHVAKETSRLVSGKKNNKQIIQHYRSKWGLSDKNAKRLLEAIAPADKGPSKTELDEKIRLRVLVGRRLGRVLRSDRGGMVSDPRKAAAEEARNKWLKPHVPGLEKEEKTSARPAGIGAIPDNVIPLRRDDHLRTAEREDTWHAAGPEEKPKNDQEQKPPGQSRPPDLPIELKKAA